MTTVGTIELIAKIDTSQYKKSAAEIDKANKDVEGSTDRADKKTGGLGKTFSTVAKVGLTAAAAGLAAVSTRVDDAVKRIDTLVAFPRVLQAMGFSAGEAASSTNKLSEKLKGLPTSLQEGASGVQKLITAGLGVSKATDAFLALNNALLASGTPTAQAEAGVQQLSQALSRGKIETEEWTSITDAMPIALTALQKETGKTKQELLEMYRTDPQKLIDDLIRLNEQGGGGISSLQDLARKATGGIGTAFTNLGIAISSGMQAIVAAIGDGGTDQKRLESGQRKISGAITNVGIAFQNALKSVAGFINFVKANKDVFGALAFSIGTVVTALIAYNTYVKVAAVLTAAHSAAVTYFTLVSSFMAQGLGVARASMLALNAAFAANPIGLVVAAIAALVAALAYFFTQTELGKQIFTNAFSAIRDAVIVTWNVITGLFGNVGGWFAARFNAAREGIIRAFSGLGGFFQGVWNNIVSIFGNIGTAVGNAIGGAFRSVINSIIGRAASIINGFIDAINAVVGVIDNIPGVDIGRIGRLPVPQLAEGGIITSPTMAMVGEGGQPEAVIPLSKLDSMLGNGGSNQGRNVEITLNMSGVMSRSRADERQIAKNLIERINEELRSKNLPQIGGGVLKGGMAR